MRITDYIEDLLYRYECVVIPDFGAFLAQRKPAQIEEDSHTFYPPKKSISFNRQLKENDGVLANYISRTEGISYEQSLQKIKSFVSDLNFTLQSHQQVTLNKIGMFYIVDERILFQPALQANFLLEAFGTSSFTAEEINRVQPVAAPAETKEEPVVVTLLPEEEEKRRPAYWRYAAIGLLALGLGGMMAANWYSDQVKSYNLAAQKQAEQQIENKIQQATFSIQDPLPTIVYKVTTERGKYHIMAGAFRSVENAEKKLEQLKNQGFGAKYIGENKYGLHQVIYDSYHSREDALNHLREIRRTENPDAWLLVQVL